MKKKIETIDEFYSFGCGRCEHGGTPECKTKTWKKELQALRKIALGCGLEETLKWSVPCFTSDGHNIVVLGAFKEYCSLSFFRGSLLKDPEGILVKPGENSRIGRLAKFTSLNQIKTHRAALVACIEQAKDVASKGMRHDSSKDEKPQLPSELEEAFAAAPKLREAFFNLTPGRQRGYLIHFSQAKQSTTRRARIEKYRSRILQGIGFHDR